MRQDEGWSEEAAKQKAWQGVASRTRKKEPHKLSSDKAPRARVSTTGEKEEGEWVQNEPEDADTGGQGDVSASWFSSRLIKNRLYLFICK